MDQVDFLRSMAEQERLAGRNHTSVELQACAAVLEARAAQEPQLTGVLLQASRKRRGARRARSPAGGEVYMPGALPAAARRAVTKEVAALFDLEGEATFKAAMETFRTAFEQAWTASSERIKAALRDKYGSTGLAKYLPFLGELRGGVLENVMEFGAAELLKMERYAPAGGPQPPGTAVPRVEPNAPAAGA